METQTRTGGADAATVRFRDEAAREQVRAADVAVLAESMTFRASRNAADPEPSTDHAQIDDWTDEGGHRR